MLEDCRFPDSCNHTKIFETHISWVALTDHYAFKIKKPVRFSFLDFSSLEKRKYFCDREIELNRRLAPEMYLDVLPISDGNKVGQKSKGKVVEYAVQMKRMDNDRAMDHLLQQGQVNRSDVKRLASVIASFHKKASMVKDPFDTTGFQEKIADILTIENEVGKELKDGMMERIRLCIDKSNNYLNSNRGCFNERVISGFRRDGHGDLKTSNIFLYEHPVIFDCAEFSDDFRHIDVLNDIAFLCVDLDFYDHTDLSRFFYDCYCKAFGLGDDEAQDRLFNFYKNYRANVKAKLAAIKSGQTSPDSQAMKTMEKYVDLMEEYSSNF